MTLTLIVCKSSGSDVQNSGDKIYDSHIQSTDYIFIIDLKFLMLTNVFKRRWGFFIYSLYRWEGEGLRILRCECSKYLYEVYYIFYLWNESTVIYIYSFLIAAIKKYCKIIISVFLTYRMSVTSGFHYVSRWHIWKSLICFMLNQNTSLIEIFPNSCFCGLRGSCVGWVAWKTFLWLILECIVQGL